MKQILPIVFLSIVCRLFSQDYFDLARASFNENDIDSARLYINKSLERKPTAEDYFLSAMIHEAENKQLRAVADYEAVILSQPDNLEAYFQKGLIYYNSASIDQAIKDFTYVIENQVGAETKAIYFAYDPTGTKGTYLTTLQSMLGRVYQYRGLAYQKNGESSLALSDFNKSFEFDITADAYINRAHLYSKTGYEKNAMQDLKSAIKLEPDNYLAWYNLAILDPSTKLPSNLVNDEEFVPMLQLIGANAYEEGDYQVSASYYTKALKANPRDDQAYIGRGKALIRTGAYSQARQDFIKAMQLNPARKESFYLIGNTFFHEKKFSEAIGFYERYLSIDEGYSNVWFNAAMSYLSLKQSNKACNCLKKATNLGMQQAESALEKHCGNQ